MHTDTVRADERSSRRGLGIVVALVAMVIAAGVTYFLLSGDDDELIESSATTAPATTLPPAVAPTTAPVTVVPTTTVPASVTTAPVAPTPATTAPPPATTVPATTAPPATAPPATTVPAPSPPWWDMAYTIDCGTGPRTFTLVNGFFDEVTATSEFYFELSREVYPLTDGSVVLKAACFTGGGEGINVLLLGLPDGTSNSSVSVPKNSVVTAFDGVTLTVESFDDTLQPPPLATYLVAVVNGQLAFVG